EQAEKAVAEIDLTGGRDFLEANWGLRSVCDWVRLKFQNIKLTPEELTGKEPAEIKQAIHAEVMKLYRQKEIEFPVKVGMASYMTDRAHPGHDGKRYDREGLFHWASQRFPGITDVITEE